MKETEEALTPIETAIKKFEELKAKSESVRDIIYLDGVMAVLDSVKEYEKNFYSEKLKSSLPSEQEIKEEIEKRFQPVSHTIDYQNTYRREGAKYILELLTKGEIPKK